MTGAGSQRRQSGLAPEFLPFALSGIGDAEFAEAAFAWRAKALTPVH